jgi:hypothetical protein
MIDLGKYGMYEQDGVLIQPFGNGKAMQVRLETDRIGVSSRQVPEVMARDTKSEDPPWFSAYDHILAEWMRSESPVWAWLREKGIDEAQVTKRLLMMH